MPTRRSVLAAVAAAPLALPSVSSANQMSPASSVRFCLNTSTIREQKLSVPEQVALCGVAGYDGIEPWIRDLRGFVDGGGDVKELRSRLDDAGVRVESAIGFAKWIVDDEAERKAGLEELRRDMQLVAALGGEAIAAPPIGAHRGAAKIDNDTIAERYAAALAIGREENVAPQLEVWGFSDNLSKLADVLYVATAVGDELACVLPDIYHLYRGGNDFASVNMLPGTAVRCFHINDISSSIAAANANDSDRVYPGLGEMPIVEVLQHMKASGFAGALSLELFNPDYWKLPAERVAREGLERMRSVAREAGLV